MPICMYYIKISMPICMYYIKIGMPIFWHKSAMPIVSNTRHKIGHKKPQIGQIQPQIGSPIFGRFLLIRPVMSVIIRNIIMGVIIRNITGIIIIIRHLIIKREENNVKNKAIDTATKCNNKNVTIVRQQNKQYIINNTGLNPYVNFEILL